MLMTTIFADEMGRSTRCHEKRKAFLCRGDFPTRMVIWGAFILRASTPATRLRDTWKRRCNRGFEWRSKLQDGTDSLEEGGPSDPRSERKALLAPHRAVPSPRPLLDSCAQPWARLIQFSICCSSRHLFSGCGDIFVLSVMT